MSTTVQNYKTLSHVYSKAMSGTDTTDALQAKTQTHYLAYTTPIRLQRMDALPTCYQSSCRQEQEINIIYKLLLNIIIFTKRPSYIQEPCNRADTQGVGHACMHK